VASDLVLVQLTPVFKQFVKQIRAFVAALVIAVSARRSPPRGSPSLSLPARTRLVFCFGFDRGLEGAEWAVSILTGAGAGTGPAAGGVQFQFSQPTGSNSSCMCPHAPTPMYGNVDCPGYFVGYLEHFGCFLPFS
jgi:hypothetical protein